MKKKMVFSLSELRDVLLPSLRDEKGELLFPVLPERSEERTDAMMALEATQYEKGYYDLVSQKQVPSTIQLLAEWATPVLLQMQIPQDLHTIIFNYFDYSNFTFKSKMSSYQYPWEEIEEYRKLTKELIDESGYEEWGKTKRFLLTCFIDWEDLFYDITPLINLIFSYMGALKLQLLDELEESIKQYQKLLPATDNLILSLANYAIEAIRYENGYNNFYYRTFSDSELWMAKFFSPPPNNAFYFLHTLITKPIFPSHVNAFSENKTFFGHLMTDAHKMDKLQVKKIPQFFNKMKAIIESALIGSAPIPQHIVFGLNKDIVNALYQEFDFLDQQYKKGKISKLLELKVYSPENLELLKMDFKALKEVKHAKFAPTYSSFFITPQNIQTMQRVINYHKRSPELKLLYSLKQPKRTFLNFSGLAGGNFIWEARESTRLIDELLDTPFASQQEYSIMGEIRQLLHMESIIIGPRAKKVLQQVLDKLLKNHPSEQSVSIQSQGRTDLVV